MRISHLLAGLAGLALSIAAPTPGDTNTLELGKITLCDGYRQTGTCHTINANMHCEQLAPPVRFNVKSLVLDKGNICSFSQGSDCNNSAFLVDSSAGTQTADVSLTWSRVLTGVRCIPGHTTGESDPPAPGVNTSIGSDLDLDLDFDVTPNPELLARQNPNPNPGDALLCAPDTHTDPCVKVPASSTCTDLPAGVDRKVRTIYQNRGSYCEYFSTDDCRGRLGYSDATRQSVRAAVPARIGDLMGSAHCIPSPLGAGAAGEGWEEGEVVVDGE